MRKVDGQDRNELYRPDRLPHLPSTHSLRRCVIIQSIEFHITAVSPLATVAALFSVEYVLLVTYAGDTTLFFFNAMLVGGGEGRRMAAANDEGDGPGKATAGARQGVVQRRPRSGLRRCR